MLSIKTIENLVSRLGIDNMNLIVDSADRYGDYICAYDTEEKLEDAIGKIINNPIFFKKIISSGLDYIELQETLLDDGMSVVVDYKLDKCDGGFGTRIKMMVKSLSSQIGDDIKVFLSYESYYEYKNRMTIEG